MIRSVLDLEPKDGDYDAVVEFFRREDVLGSALSQRGCLGGKLHVPTNGSGPILVTALWESADAYQGWVTTPFAWSPCAGEPAPRLDFNPRVRLPISPSANGDSTARPGYP